MGSLTVNQFNQMITKRAVQIANHTPDIGKHPDFTFHEESYASTKTPEDVAGICMEWDRESGLYTFPTDEQERIVRQMDQAARKAVKQALIEHKDELGRVILDEAREGRNYFEVFKQGPDLEILPS